MTEGTFLTLENIVFLTSGIFAFAACIIAAVQVFLHLRNWTSPVIQRLIIRMLLMCPVYAVNSWLGIFLKEYAVYVNTLRSCYESFVIHTFFTYLMEISGGREELVEYLSKLPEQKHMIPVCCLRFQPGVAFLRQCRQFTLQYVYVNVSMTLLGLILNFFGLLDEGNFTPERGYLYITILNNASVLVAMYYLVLFYNIAKEKLKEHKPLLKFFVVKAVVFFSFWQGVAVAVGAKAGIITAVDDWTVEEVSSAIQDFLICVEMLAAAILFHKAFPYSVFKGDEPTSLLSSAKNAMAIGDVATESVELFVPRDRHHELPLAVRRQLALRGGPVFDEEFTSQDHRPLRVHEIEKPPGEPGSEKPATGILIELSEQDLGPAPPTASAERATLARPSADRVIIPAQQQRNRTMEPDVVRVAFAPSGGGFADNALFTTQGVDELPENSNRTFSAEEITFSLPDVELEGDSSGVAAAAPSADAAAVADAAGAADAADEGSGAADTVALIVDHSAATSTAGDEVSASGELAADRDVALSGPVPDADVDATIGATSDLSAGVAATAAAAAVAAEVESHVHVAAVPVALARVAEVPQEESDDDAVEEDSTEYGGDLKRPLNR